MQAGVWGAQPPSKILLRVLRCKNEYELQVSMHTDVNASEGSGGPHPLSKISLEALNVNQYELPVNASGPPPLQDLI